jgi:hypothetical protein
MFSKKEPNKFSDSNLFQTIRIEGSVIFKKK